VGDLGRFDPLSSAARIYLLRRALRQFRAHQKSALARLAEWAGTPPRFDPGYWDANGTSVLP